MAQTVRTEGQTTPDPNTQTASPDVLSPEALLDTVVQAKGPVPGVQEGMDEKDQLILENQYRIQTQFDIQHMEKGIRELAPNITNSDAQKYVIAAVSKDWMEAFKIAQDSARKQAEKETNDTKNEDIRVEGANSGTKGDQNPVFNTRQDLVNAIVSEYDV